MQKKKGNLQHSGPVCGPALTTMWLLSGGRRQQLTQTHAPQLQPTDREGDEGRWDADDPIHEPTDAEGIPLLKTADIQAALPPLAEAATPQAARPLGEPWEPWRVARAQILADQIPWPGMGDTTAEHQLTYDLYRDTEVISEVVAGPFTVRHTTTAAATKKARKQANRKRRRADNHLEQDDDPTTTQGANSHETQYTVTWPHSIIPLSVLRAYVRQGYSYASVQEVQDELGPHLDKYFRKVTWKTSDMPLWNLERDPNFPAALQRYKAARNTPRDPRPTRPAPARDQSLTNAQKQGWWDPPDEHAATRKRTLRGTTTINTIAEPVLGCVSPRPVHHPVGDACTLSNKPCSRHGIHSARVRPAWGVRGPPHRSPATPPPCTLAAHEGPDA